MSRLRSSVSSFAVKVQKRAQSPRLMTGPMATITVPTAPTCLLTSSPGQGDRRATPQKISSLMDLITRRRPA